MTAYIRKLFFHVENIRHVEKKVNEPSGCIKGREFLN